MSQAIQISIIVILFLCLGVLLASLLFPVTANQAEPTLPQEESAETLFLPEPEPAQTADAAPSTEPPPVQPSTAHDTAPIPPPLPEPLTQALGREGLSAEDLSALGCRQLILVQALPGEERETVTTCFDLEGDTWTQVPELSRLPGHVGKNGVACDRRRNTETTPAGLWAMGFAFGNSPQPEGMTWPWRDVTPNSDWVCDENSPYFNTWQERGDPDLLPWSDDVEHLEDYSTQYAYACVIEYNTPPGEVVPNRGCAIFLHCSTGPTGGCVGLETAAMIAVLQWLSPEYKPHILILPPSE